MANLIPIRQNLAPQTRFAVLAPHTMNPTGITIHNTANDAPADNEARNVINNSTGTSFHFAVDDREVVQILPLNRNAWHASDGANGPGNRGTIAIEICFSRSGGARFTAAERNTARLCARLLRERNWTTRNIFTHQHFDPRSQNCPHRTMSLGWQRFLNMVQAELNALNKPVAPSNGDWTAGDLNQNVRVTSTTLNVRSARNATSNVVRTLRRGDIVRIRWVLGINDRTPIDTPWGAIEGGGQFINMNHVELVSAVQHFPVPPGNPSGIVAALNSINVDSGFNNRLRIAQANGISNYTGTAAQNNQLLNSLRQGLLIKP